MSLWIYSVPYQLSSSTIWHKCSPWIVRWHFFLKPLPHMLHLYAFSLVIPVNRLSFWFLPWSSVLIVKPFNTTISFCIVESGFWICVEDELHTSFSLHSKAVPDVALTSCGGETVTTAGVGLFRICLRSITVPSEWCDEGWYSQVVSL